MSSFLCTPEHLAQLAGVLGDWRSANQPALAEILARENWRSVACRYGENSVSTSRTLGEYVAETIEATSTGRDATLKTIDLLKMANCYEYQACENDDYAGTTAAKTIEHIRGDLVRQLPEYEDAVYAYQKETKEGVWV